MKKGVSVGKGEHSEKGRGWAGRGRMSRRNWGKVRVVLLRAGRLLGGMLGVIRDMPKGKV